MPALKVLEISGEGETLEEAIHSAVRKSSKIGEEIQQVYVESIHALFKNGKTTSYRVSTKISCIVEDK